MNDQAHRDARRAQDFRFFTLDEVSLQLEPGQIMGLSARMAPARAPRCA
jgi:hypothetical protein